MKVKRKAYWWLLVLTIIFTLSIISTLIPAENANKVCLLGYKAHCLRRVEHQAPAKSRRKNRIGYNG